MDRPSGTRAFWIGVSLVGLLLVGGRAATAEEDLVLDIPAGLRTVGPGENDAFGIGFLPMHQAPDGSWSARDWDRWCGGFPQTRDPRLPGRAEADHDLAATSLAFCAFLGAGYTHRGRHPHARTVGRAMRWLKRRQQADGNCALSGDPDPVVAHAIATLGLTENFGMTASGLTRHPSRRALEFLRRAQRPSGAWPLSTGRGDDALATFWAGLALKSAALINADTLKRDKPAPYPAEVTQELERAATWFRARTEPATGIVGASEAERRRGAPTLVLTAAGALLRVFAGENPRAKGSLRAACEHLAQNLPTWAHRTPQRDGLYIYIGTLVTFQAGGKVWDLWKRALWKAVVEHQIHAAARPVVRAPGQPR